LKWFIVDEKSRLRSLTPKKGEVERKLLYCGRVLDESSSRCLISGAKMRGMSNAQNRRIRVSLLASCYIALGTSAFAESTADWQQYTDTILHVTFRYPKGWRTSPGESDRSSFEGSNGAVQLSAAGGANPLHICQQEAAHVVQPFGTHPTIRSMKVQRQRACLVWPSKDQALSLGKGRPLEAELVVEFPRPLEIEGNSYGQLTLRADTKHIVEIMKTVRFIDQH
jgi:TolB protein